MPITHTISAQHASTFYEILYRNGNIVRITVLDPERNPRGTILPYDSLSLAERESILIAIINHLNNATEN